MMCRASHSLSLTNDDDDVVPLCEIKAAGKETQKKKRKEKEKEKKGVSSG